MWQTLIENLENKLLSEFRKDMGVDLPDAINAYIREKGIRVQYATNVDLSNFTKAITNVVEDAIIAVDYPKLALDVIGTASNFVTGVIGNGVLKAGVQSTCMKSIIKEVNNPNEEITFVTAIYAVTAKCEGIQWRTNSNFYVTKFAFVVWTPAKDHLNLFPDCDSK